MHTGVEVAQSGLHSAVAGKAAKCRQFGRAQFDGKVAFTGPVITAVACVAVAFVHHLQLGHVKGGPQARLNLILYRHFHFSPFNLPPNALFLRA
jgi:hypothetical protein